MLSAMRSKLMIPVTVKVDTSVATCPICWKEIFVWLEAGMAVVVDLVLAWFTDVGLLKLIMEKRRRIVLR